MNDHALKLLEFEKIIQSLCSYALTEEGRRSITADLFLTNPKEVRQRVGLAVAFRRCLEGARGNQSDTGFTFPEIEGMLPLLAKQGGALETLELKSISRFAASAAKRLAYRRSFRARQAPLWNA